MDRYVDLYVEHQQTRHPEYTPLQQEVALNMWRLQAEEVLRVVLSNIVADVKSHNPINFPAGSGVEDLLDTPDTRQ